MNRSVATVLTAMGIALFLATPSTAFGQRIKENFAGRTAIVINDCPFIELSDFSFENSYRNQRIALETNLKWKNTGKVPITAFEVVVSMYDPFNRPIESVGGRWLIPGTDSANWTALAPDATGQDGLLGFNTEYVFTAFAFVRTARLEDGTVWTFNDRDVIRDVQAKLPQLKDFSNVNPPLPKPTGASR